MRESGSGTAAVEVDDAPILVTREDDALVEGVVTRGVDQAETLKQIEGVAFCREIAAQVSARGIADPQFTNQVRIMQSALFQISQRLGVMLELLLIEIGGLLQHGGWIFPWSLRIEICDALAKGQASG